MKTLSSYVNEKLTDSNILAHTHKGLQPSDIRNFIAIAKKEGFNVDEKEDDGGYISVYDDKEYIARIDPEELEVTTNMSKQSFFDVALRKKSGILTKLFK